MKLGWPAWSPELVKRPFPPKSLLEGTEPLVWEALGQLDAKDFQNTGKQVALRKALRKVDLGWIATNDTVSHCCGWDV
jgi:hypothetical protein